MSLINRSVVIVYAREPFLEWLHANSDERPPLDEINVGCPAFLIEDFEYEDDAMEAINEEWEVYFETWLESWVDDAKKWPENRSLEMFHEWFHVALHPMVFDRLDENILHEDEFDAPPGPSGRALH